VVVEHNLTDRAVGLLIDLGPKAVRVEARGPRPGTPREIARRAEIPHRSRASRDGISRGKPAGEVAASTGWAPAEADGIEPPKPCRHGFTGFEVGEATSARDASGPVYKKFRRMAAPVVKRAGVTTYSLSDTF